MKKFNKGFTLIELLVVIAIIGILSSIVLASLSSARTKGEDTAIQTTLGNMRAQAELYYATNNKYGNNTAATSGVCPNAAVTDDTSGEGMFGLATGGLLSLSQGLVSRAGSANTECTVAALGASWAAAAKLKSTGVYCVDSTGRASSSAATTAAGAITAGACN